MAGDDTSTFSSEHRRSAIRFTADFDGALTGAHGGSRDDEVPAGSGSRACAHCLPVEDAPDANPGMSVTVAARSSDPGDARAGQA
jgi:hypothetical protein